MTTIQQQQITSAALTALSWITSAFALLSVLASNVSNALLGVVATGALAFINHYQSATETISTAPAVVKPVIASTGTNTNTVTATSLTEKTAFGRYTGTDGKEVVIMSLTGTRILVASTFAFQVIDDRISPNFIVGSAGANALAAPPAYTFSGNLALVMYNATLY
jgi:hypothetical protein